MPSIIKVRIQSARNLPVMDRATELTDAFVEVRYADYDVVRTKVCRRTLNPTWNEDFRIVSFVLCRVSLVSVFLYAVVLKKEVSKDKDVQNEPLEIKVMDYDQITYSDAIGAVFIDLNPLLAWDSKGRDSNSLSGWFPIFDSLRGICGEIFITVKLQFFGDTNQYSDSSSAIQFFTTPAVPPTYIVTKVNGYVSALQQEDDPEYHWADNFRTPRTSNDARMRIMYKLSGELRRQLGKKVELIGGNAVLGYKQYFEFETEQRTITARAIGTAVTLATPEQVMATMITSPSLGGDVSSRLDSARIEQTPGQLNATSAGNLIGFGGLVDPVTVSNNTIALASAGGQTIAATATSSNRQSTISPMGGTIIPPTPLAQISTNRIPTVESPLSSPTDTNMLPPPAMGLLTLPSASTKQIDVYPVTLTAFPPGTIQGLGGLVCATSIKILDGSQTDIERERWWMELRDEIKSHARSLRCSLILGYSEHTAVCDELAVLYCYGTAAVVDFGAFGGLVPSSAAAVLVATKSRVASSSSSIDLSEDQDEGMARGSGCGPSSGAGIDIPFMAPTTPGMGPRGSMGVMNSFKESTAYFEKMTKQRRIKKKKKNPGCQACHITNSRAEAYQTNTIFTRCGVCKKKFVPEVILSTIEPPSELETIGKPVLVEAHVCRIKKSRAGESHAVIVSESMPFAQYDIHRQLLFKLRIHGLNAIFGLKIQYSIGESLMTAVATGTAVYLKALPPPPPLKLQRTLEVEDAEDRALVEDQIRIMKQSEDNRKAIEAALLASEVSAQQPAAQTATLGHQGGSMESLVGKSTKKRVDAADEAGGVEEPGRDSAISNEDDSDSDSEESQSSDSDPDYEVGTRQRNVVVQIDDEHDEDLILMMATQFREGFQLKNIETAIQSEALDRTDLYTVQSIAMVRQGFIKNSSHHPNRQLARLFQDVYQELQFQFSYISPCMIVGINYDIQVLKMNEIQIRLTGAALGIVSDGTDDSSDSDLEDIAGSLCLSDRAGSPSRKSISKNGLNLGPRQMTETSLVSMTEDDKGESDDDSVADDEDLMYSDDEVEEVKHQEQNNVGGSASAAIGAAATPPATAAAVDCVVNQALNSNPSSPSPNRLPSSFTGGLVSSTKKESMGMTLVQVPRAIEITPLSYVPQSRIEKFLGRVSLHFVKEASILYEVGSVNGGMGGFAHALLAEFYAVARSYTVAMGGNAMISFTVEESMFYESIKNQGYSLISVSGDVVQVAFSSKRKAIYEHQQKHHHSVLLM
ncbi:hypothetical protein BDR26DRAFT_921829 [Obelidium mucronatum]|nr:hypothetical protein BDR26DRAFT_921829 [Obelidium mucronatum]